ncbi:GATA zinc finger domain-containing protein 10 [Fusarium austroafricanum]|uniref:GATA zinc finger domain-containing protein 10 n=1 Tax=Fusarium austroafricanum TaxID=2364996 RepID=A0A8H4KPY1_9HYPO|nr:GATA zinc finger domain-containing protein 10 [Fusarium austroafricanum]
MKPRPSNSSKPALAGRRRRDRAHAHAHPCRVDLPESSLFPPRRCSFARSKTPRHNIRPSVQDVQRTGLPLCEVALFQTAAIPSPLAAKPESREAHLQLKVASRTSSLRSPAASARSIRSRSARTSLKDTYEARTWRNRLRRHSRSPKSHERAPCCTSCFIKETPMWREGPFGSHTLCNVCGLLYAKREARSRSILLQREVDRVSQLS